MHNPGNKIRKESKGAEKLRYNIKKEKKKRGKIFAPVL